MELRKQIILKHLTTAPQISQTVRPFTNSCLPALLILLLLVVVVVVMVAAVVVAVVVLVVVVVVASVLHL